MKLEHLMNRKNALLIVACCVSLPLLLITLKALEKRKRQIKEFQAMTAEQFQS